MQHQKQTKQNKKNNQPNLFMCQISHCICIVLVTSISFELLLRQRRKKAGQYIWATPSRMQLLCYWEQRRRKHEMY